jgi:hypothetical protein
VSLFLGVVCVVIGRLSRSFGDLIMGIISIILNLTFQYRTTDYATSVPQFQVPQTVASALSQFHLDGNTVVYAVCPVCHCTHKPKISGTTILYPSTCTNKHHPEASICGEPLLKEGGMQPIKTFVYHKFDDYLAGLLSRPDLEKMMNEPCEKLRNILRSQGTDGDDVRMKDEDEIMRDVFDAAFLKSFPGPSGENFFIECPAKDGRFAFALHIDFFNPEGLGIHTASTSCGIISMACLNLPVHQRYKPQNMYICVIPGPKEPSLTELNHYIKPLIDDMVLSWTRGVYFSRTALKSSGRLTKSAIVACLCDLQAARKASQMSPARSHFYCSVCDCHHLSTLGRTDYSNWSKRNVADLRSQAEAWKNASTIAEKEQLFKKNGIRWSELWRLPYWNPPCQLMVDAMHCLFEGLVRLHVLEMLELREKKTEKPSSAFKHDFQEYDGQFPPNLKDKEIKQIGQIHTLLTAPIDEDDAMTTSSVDTDNISILSISKSQSFEQLKNRLKSKNRGPLSFVCHSEVPGNFPIGTTHQLSKDELVQILIDWRKSKPLRVSEDRKIQFDTNQVLQHIRSTIRLTITPSWLSSVPHNFGSAAAGVLKADEWRSVATIYLPLALVTLWGEKTNHKSAKIASEMRLLLDHTMSLFSAIHLACSPTISHADAEEYRKMIASYMENLQKLYPMARHHPNHHMALHIYDFLLLFGPARSMWCFPFERLVGILQKTSTNHKQNEMESTMINSFIRASRLKSWLERPCCPPAILKCKMLLDKMDYTNSLDYYEHKDQNATSNLLTENISYPAIYRQGKFVYGKSSTHLGNSLVQFYPDGERNMSPIPGCIQSIELAGNNVFFHVLRLQPINEDLDPFRHYPYIQMKTYSSTWVDEVERIPFSWILSHIALYPLSSADLVVVVSLHRGLT